MNVTQSQQGVFSYPNARIIDRRLSKRLPIGRDGWAQAAESYVLVDKTMLIADIIDAGYAATLFCRPRRFGKSLNMTMLKAFFEIPPASEPAATDLAPLFEGTEIWEAENGRYRQYQGAFPVIYLSLNAVKRLSWHEARDGLRAIVTSEYQRHRYLAESQSLTDDDKAYFARVRAASATDEDYARSLLELARLLKRHHGRGVIILIDEYDAPVMAGYTNGYYNEVVSFLKSWLTGALKDGGAALEFSCLTGVQRISKESVFSDLNNIVVDTSLSTEFEERYGFTEAEVSALANHLGQEGHMEEARRWYDGYRFGTADVYNPWSVLRYFDAGCAPDVYWGNTSTNDVLGDLLRHADQAMLGEVYTLLEPGGTVTEPLNLGVAFPDVRTQPETLWSLLYLAGYLTTRDVAQPNNARIPRRLGIPNHEVSELYRAEIVERFAKTAGGASRLAEFHQAVIAGDRQVVQRELARILNASASTFDLTSENSAHMLVLGLLFGMPGYGDPQSNREHGSGRPDIRVEPVATPFDYAPRPLVTIELKFTRSVSSEELERLAHEGLEQIERLGYDEDALPGEASGRIRWGIAVSGKRVATAVQARPQE